MKKTLAAILVILSSLSLASRSEAASTPASSQAILSYTVWCGYNGTWSVTWDTYTNLSGGVFRIWPASQQGNWYPQYATISSDSGYFTRTDAYNVSQQTAYRQVTLTLIKGGQSANKSKSQSVYKPASCT